jgi:hypothetical protein
MFLATLWSGGSTGQYKVVNIYLRGFICNILLQYIIRVDLQPPQEMSGSCPSFEHEEDVQITTDPYGALERELTATGGMPTPALALAPDWRQPGWAQSAMFL